MLRTMSWSAKFGSFIDQLQSFSESTGRTNQKYKITYTADKSIIHYYEKTKTFDSFFEINKCGHETMNFEQNWSKCWLIWMKRVRKLKLKQKLKEKLEQGLKQELDLTHELKIHFILLMWISDADRKFLNKKYLKKLIFFLLIQVYSLYAANVDYDRLVAKYNIFRIFK